MDISNRCFSIILFQEAELGRNILGAQTGLGLEGASAEGRNLATLEETDTSAAAGRTSGQKTDSTATYFLKMSVQVDGPNRCQSP